MDYLPLFHNLKQQPCLLIGGGVVALRKARLLHRCGCHLTVIAEDIHPELKALLKETHHSLNTKKLNVDDIQKLPVSFVLVIAATNNVELNKAISLWAKAYHLPVNVVDSPDLCSVIMPSIVDRSPIIAAVSSGGKAPVLARHLRGKLETQIPAAYGSLAQLAGKFRQQVKQTLPDALTRHRFWESIFSGITAEMVFSGKQAEAEAQIQKELSNVVTKNPHGEVYLIGAGPGDPDLFTFKALRLLQQADVVLYDRLVAPEILDLARKDAEFIYVGKQRQQHTFRQEEINSKIIEYAKQGLRVARLKGGDPFIFGRGGEEIAQLTEKNIPFQVVPGITAATGCSSYAGIPLTHRDYAHSVRFLTGHGAGANKEPDIDWSSIKPRKETLVFYMGQSNLAFICQQLIQCGFSQNYPIAFIEQGTTVNQKTHIATLATLEGILADKTIKGPTLLIVGETVKLHQSLAWFKENNNDTI